MSIVAIVCVIYALVGLLLVRPLAGHFAWHFFRQAKIARPYSSERQQSPDGAQWLGATTIAVTCAIALPLVALWMIADRKLPRIGAEKRAELERREEEIKKAERELGIGQ